MGNKILITFTVIIALLFAVPIYAYAADELTGTVSITSDGSPQYGETVAADTSAVTNNTGTFTYQWTRNGTDITGAVVTTYTLAADDIGASIAVNVSSTVETGIITSATISAGKANREAPAAPTLLSGDHYNIILNEVTGCEYKIAGGNYTEDNSFSNLISNKEYIFYQRYKENATHNASPASAALNVTTDYVILANATYNIDNLNAGDGVLINGNVTLNGTQSIRVYCNSGASLTLQNSRIDASEMAGECAIEFAGNGSLILSGVNYVYSGSRRAAIETNSSLSISGSGSLLAIGGANGAGIGGGNGENGGTINITGGLIYAAGQSADDIGGGNGGSQGSLNISGGSAVFLKNNNAPIASTSSHIFYSAENVSGGKAYGYTLPSLWAEGDSAYGYINYCTVSFDTNGGSAIASQSVGAAAYIVLPEEPAKEGLIFGGWYSDSALTNEFNVSSDRIYGDTTLYAKWNVVVTIATSEGGATNPDVERIIEFDGDLVIECIPDENFEIGVVTSSQSHTIVDNEDNTYTIQNIQTADTIEIVFESTILLGTVTIDHDGSPECREKVGVNTTKIENKGVALLYQWTRDGIAISGANDEEYMLSTEDVGHMVGVIVSSGEKQGELIDTIAMRVEKAMKAAPRPPVLSLKTTDTITLEIVDGCEYKIEDGSWQDSNIFTELIPETEYTFYQRYKETGSHKESNQSFSLKVTTDGFSVERIVFSIEGIRLHIDDTEDLSTLFHYSIYPENAMNQDVIWSSSNEMVAVIDSENGTITAVGEGKTTITIIAADEKNGTLTDTCILQVYDPAPADANAYLGELTGRLLDYQGKVLSGYTITLYSNPTTIITDAQGEFKYNFIAYTNHILIVENDNSEEIGRYDISWVLGEKEKAVIDNDKNTLTITYTNITQSISIPFEINKDINDINIRTFEGISFVDEEGNETNSKKLYMLVLMGIIAACIIGVGYILYIGRIQRGAPDEGNMEELADDFYEQVLLGETTQGSLDISAVQENNQIDSRPATLEDDIPLGAEIIINDDKKSNDVDISSKELESIEVELAKAKIRKQEKERKLEEKIKIEFDDSTFQGHVELIDKDKNKK